MLKCSLLYACRVAAALVFVVSAVLKFFSIDAFELYVYSLGFFSLSLSFVFARVLIAFEFALGLSLASNQYRSVVNFFSYAALAGFSVFLLYLIALGNEDNCHCMGTYVEFSPLQSLIKNGVLALLVFASHKGLSFSLPKAPLILLALPVFSLLTVFIVSPPDSLAKPVKVLHREAFDQFVQTDSIYTSQYASQPVSLICLYSTGCRVCKLSAHKLQLMLDKYHVPANRVYNVFVGDNAHRLLFYQKAQAQPYTFTLLANDPFWRLTSSVPVFVVLRKGKMVGQYNYRNLSEEAVRSLAQ